MNKTLEFIKSILIAVILGGIVGLIILMSYGIFVLPMGQPIFWRCRVGKLIQRN